MHTTSFSALPVFHSMSACELDDVRTAIALTLGDDRLGRASPQKLLDLVAHRLDQLADLAEGEASFGMAGLEQGMLQKLSAKLQGLVSPQTLH